MTEKKTGLDLLREPFPANQISKLPKPTKAQTDEVKADYKKGIRCDLCGAWHHPKVVHLDYVGHAALTDRLLDSDPQWSWEPLSISDGLPVFDGFGGMWIRLTVAGVSRLGYGHAGEKNGGDAIKEVIGDALRNAAMRFGAALDLWHKGDLHAKEDAAAPGADSDPALMKQLEDSIEQIGQAKTGALAAAAEDAGTRLDANTKAALGKLSIRVSEHFNEQGEAVAFDLVEEQGLTGDEKTFLWAKLDSKIRSALKREGQHRSMSGVPK